MLFLHGVEGGRELTEVLGRPQHAQGVAGRRCINGDYSFRILLRDLADSHPGHQLIHARKRQLEKAPQLLLVEIRAAVAELQEAWEVLLEELRVEIFRVQRFDQKVVGLSGCRVVEEIGQVACRVGREEDRFARAAEVQRCGGRDGGFADAPFAAEENDVAVRERVERVTLRSRCKSRCPRPPRRDWRRPAARSPPAARGCRAGP